MLIRVLTLFLICTYAKGVTADAFGAEIITLTSHISRYTIQLGDQYHRKLSSNGRHVITPGLEIYYDKHLLTKLSLFRIDSVRYVIAAYLDSMNHFSGYLAFTPRWSFFKQRKTYINIGAGPTLIFRESWNRIPEYRDDGYYHESGGIFSGYQYKFIIGGDVNLHYSLDSQTELVWSVIPGLPYVITHAFGFRRLF